MKKRKCRAKKHNQKTKMTRSISFVDYYQLLQTMLPSDYTTIPACVKFGIGWCHCETHPMEVSLLVGIIT